MTAEQRARVRVEVEGIVQGVGFRPHAYRIARELDLGGFVVNDAGGVVIEIEGAPEGIEEFERRLVGEAPPLARIERAAHRTMPPRGERTFRIRDSDSAGRSSTPIAPDVATCAQCREEMWDEHARRWRYAFTNCTNCGPRFTITTRVPYDRPNTTMAGFAMCAACRREYVDPSDRRFHAQPIACPACGPALRALRPAGHPIAGDPVDVVARVLLDGGIVAVKGVGGYHLACDAGSEAAVAELRRRKQREEKPLAVMVSGLDAARALVRLDGHGIRVLTSVAAPIVLLPRIEGAPVAPSVAPGNRWLGIVVPYSPLHHLLMRALDRPIVLTSGNISDEPIAYRDEDALQRLGPLVDALLTHDRPIHVRCDDSVVRVVDGAPYFIRRSRGYAPEPVGVDVEFARPVLGVGAELKHTFCLATGRRALLSHHIGDLETWEAMTAFEEGVEHWRRAFGVRAEVMAHDLHPDYLSTKWALAADGVEVVGIQHHHAHIAACLADNRRTDRVIGLALDGTGYGDDGAIWGCEVLACDPGSYVRHLHLRYAPMPGGAAAIREPWRMAAAHLEAAFGAAAPELDVARRAGDAWEPVLAMARRGLNSPLTSSAGRLFDAAAAICGVRDRTSYEGQAAAELEQIADPGGRRAYPCPVGEEEIDGTALLAALATDVASGTAIPDAASAFHSGLARALGEACAVVRERERLTTVALSGGTWQNLLLLERVRADLAARGFEVLLHRRVPCNDGGIALGQVVAANARLGASCRPPLTPTRRAAR